MGADAASHAPVRIGRAEDGRDHGGPGCRGSLHGRLPGRSCRASGGGVQCHAAYSWGRAALMPCSLPCCTMSGCGRAPAHECHGPCETSFSPNPGTHDLSGHRRSTSHRKRGACCSSWLVPHWRPRPGALTCRRSRGPSNGRRAPTSPPRSSSRSPNTAICAVASGRSMRDDPCIGPSRPRPSAQHWTTLGSLRCRRSELPAIHVEISVLGPFHQLVDQDAFRPGIDGLVVESGGHVALLLPEVATASSWRALEMFTAVCRKAGLPSDAWRDPRTRLSVFRTDRFGGPAIESRT